MFENGLLTNVEKDGAIVPFVDDMVLKDFIVEGLGFFRGGRHIYDTCQVVWCV